MNVINMLYIKKIYIFFIQHTKDRCFKEEAYCTLEL